MPVLYLVLVAFAAVCADGVAALLKKISTGRFDAHFSEMDEEMRKRAFLPCFSLGATVFPMFLSVMAVYFLGKNTALFLAVFVIGAHAVYRTLLLISDIIAKKYPVADNDMSRQKARTGRRWAALIIGIQALIVAAILTFLARNQISFYLF